MFVCKHTDTHTWTGRVWSAYVVNKFVYMFYQCLGQLKTKSEHCATLGHFHNLSILFATHKHSISPDLLLFRKQPPGQAHAKTLNNFTVNVNITNGTLALFRTHNQMFFATLLRSLSLAHLAVALLSALPAPSPSGTLAVLQKKGQKSQKKICFHVFLFDAQHRSLSQKKMKETDTHTHTHTKLGGKWH